MKRLLSHVLAISLLVFAYAHNMLAADTPSPFRVGISEEQFALLWHPMPPKESATDKRSKAQHDQDDKNDFDAAERVAKADVAQTLQDIEEQKKLDSRITALKKDAVPSKSGVPHESARVLSSVEDLTVATRTVDQIANAERGSDARSMAADKYAWQKDYEERVSCVDSMEFDTVPTDSDFVNPEVEALDTSVMPSSVASCENNEAHVVITTKPAQWDNCRSYDDKDAVPSKSGVPHESARALSSVEDLTVATRAVDQIAGAERGSVARLMAADKYAWQKDYEKRFSDVDSVEFDTVSTDSDFVNPEVEALDTSVMPSRVASCENNETHVVITTKPAQWDSCRSYSYDDSDYYWRKHFTDDESSIGLDCSEEMVLRCSVVKRPCRTLCALALVGVACWYAYKNFYCVDDEQEDYKNDDVSVVPALADSVQGHDNALSVVSGKEVVVAAMQSQENAPLTPVDDGRKKVVRVVRKRTAHNNKKLRKR